MASTFVPISTADQWVKGEVYRLSYTVDHIKLWGYDVPDFLIPDAIREAQAKRQISALVDKLRSDPRYEVIGYEYAGTNFQIDLIARENPFPVAIVVVGIVAVAVLFGIAFVTREVGHLVEKADQLAETVGPVGSTIGIATIAVVVGVGAFFLIKAKA